MEPARDRAEPKVCGALGTRGRAAGAARAHAAGARCGCGDATPDAVEPKPTGDTRTSGREASPAPTSLRPDPLREPTKADAGSAGAARGYLELGVAEHHQGRAGADAVALDEGHVHAPDPPQPREGRVPLPRLRVPDHDEGLQPGLLPEGDTRPAHSGPRTSGPGAAGA